MGIKGLSKLLGDNAPRAIKELDLKSFFGRKIAIDASMCIYQLLVAMRVGADNMTNSEGDITSHLIGMFYRTIRLVELGIKPVYVFDGKPPPMKGGELQKRAEAKKNAEEAAKKAEEEGDKEALEKYMRRINTVTPEMTEACKKVVKLMGIPVVEAPCEAEAQCAELCKGGLVYATASEDMDSLTFGTTILLRQLWAGASSTASKKGVKPTQFTLAAALEDLDLSMDQFIDMCILCGCDYVDGIRGIGQVKALNLIKKHKNIEGVVDSLKGAKGYSVPEEYPIEKVRELFKAPEVTPASEVGLKWLAPDSDGLIEFMVKENQVDEARVRNGIKKLEAARRNSTQVRLENFFKPVASPKQVGAINKGKPTVKGKVPEKNKRRVGSTASGKVAKKRRN